MRTILRRVIGKSFRLPPDLYKLFVEAEFSAPYLASCLGPHPLVYVSPRFEGITGYSCEAFIHGGNAFWFSLIHPADMQSVVGSITRAQHELIANPHPTAPLKLEYRITRGDGRLIWIREFKQIVSYQNGKKDHILGCLHDITAEKSQEQAAVEALLARERSAHGLLNVAVSYQLNNRATSSHANGAAAHRISAREKQVLRLVAAGHASKQIAAKLAISENTVETHRRHLLRKFKVNSSPALVQEAHRQCLV